LQHISDQDPDPSSLYADLARSFAKTLDRIGKGEKKIIMEDEDR
jgi:hypothetical protein